MRGYMKSTLVKATRAIIYFRQFFRQAKILRILQGYSANQQQVIRHVTTEKARCKH